jgi:hypothetical protein
MQDEAHKPLIINTLVPDFIHASIIVISPAATRYRPSEKGFLY